MLGKFVASLQKFLRWFFGAPVSDLPPAFGDTVPADLRAFAARAEIARQHQQEVLRHRGAPRPHTKPSQANVPLQRM